MSEKSILNNIQLLASKMGIKLWRNNVGSAWQGRARTLANGDVLIQNPRRVTYGLPVGSGDLIGCTPVVITNDMVGKKLLIFTNYEAKCNATRTTDEQRAFHNMVNSLGGISIIDRFSSDNIEGNTLHATINQFQGSVDSP